MRLLVTGSAGFIGKHVVAAAKARGWQVTGVDTRDSDNPMDARDIREVSADVALHLGAFASNAGFTDCLAANYANNTMGLLNIAQLCYEKGARLLYASSSAVYGTNLGRWECDDNQRVWRPGCLPSHYAKSKLINEAMAESYRACGLSVLGLRIFNAYGPGDELKPHPSPVSQMQAAKAAGKPWVCYGDGTQAKDFIHVSDVVEIIMRLIESDATGVVNVGTGIATSFNDLAKLIGCEVQYTPTPDPVSYQYYTRADTRELLHLIGAYEFVGLVNLAHAQPYPHVACRSLPEADTR
jgi:nucleoside-diphosphate-sugar epimerase